MLLRKIDIETGRFIEDVMSKAEYYNQEGELLREYVSEKPNGKFYLPSWDGLKWVEALSNEEIKIKNNQLPSEISDSEKALKKGEINSSTIDSILTEVLPSLFM